MTSNAGNEKPPGIATRFLRWYCKPALVEDLEGDLLECFTQNVKAKGLLRAKLIYIVDVILFIKPYTMRRLTFFNFIIQWMMVGSYFKTSARNLTRNKLFSSINVIGMAVSMSVGLLMIAFLSDFLSYDSFHKNQGRIFRINSEVKDQYGEVDLATTSFKLGKDLLETGGGFENLTILGNGFGGDAQIGDAKIPIGGMWASKTFFDVFSFPLIHGNPGTALSEPYSLVLSEKIAFKLFNSVDVVGKSVKLDTVNYVVTAVMKDIPKLSHLRPEVLASIATCEVNYPAADKDLLSWSNIYSHYVYVTTPTENPATLRASIDRIVATETKISNTAPIKFTLQPLHNIVLSKIGNAPGTTFPALALWIMGVLAFIVIISACFNYTNLSIARSIRRGREVGIRKVIGAAKSHVLGQFIAESVILSLVALAVSFVLFLFYELNSWR